MDEVLFCTVTLFIILIIFLTLTTVGLFIPFKNIRKILLHNEKILKNCRAMRFVPVDKYYHAAGELYLTNKRIIFIPKFLNWKAYGFSIFGNKFFSKIYFLKVKKVYQSHDVDEWGSRLNIETKDEHYQFHFIVIQKNQESTLTKWEDEINDNMKHFKKSSKPQTF
ncbi:GRAM domain-containing protein [[Eubacterium] cellulosolvens]